MEGAAYWFAWLNLFYLYFEPRDGGTHSGLNSPTWMIIKKNPPQTDLPTGQFDPINSSTWVLFLDNANLCQVED